MIQSNNAKTIDSALTVLSEHGKSFRFAGRFLDKELIEKCARLYRFCRYLDDSIDEALDSESAIYNLQELKYSLDNGSSFNHITQDFINLTKQTDMQRNVVDELIYGIASDLNKVLFKNEKELIQYCYRVAGTVGLLMCDIFGVKDKKARMHAIDLGIAMQLTNIARDVKEDAELGRRYLPSEWIGEISPEEISENTFRPKNLVKISIERLLKIADQYYISGIHGIRFLPSGARLGILVAAQTYREIGIVIKEKKYNFYAERAYVGLLRKIQVAAKSLFFYFKKEPYIEHDSKLHYHLNNFPDAHKYSV